MRHHEKLKEEAESKGLMMNEQYTLKHFSGLRAKYQHKHVEEIRQGNKKKVKIIRFLCFSQCIHTIYTIQERTHHGIFNNKTTTRSETHQFRVNHVILNRWMTLFSGKRKRPSRFPNNDKSRCLQKNVLLILLLKMVVLPLGIVSRN